MTGKSWICYLLYSPSYKRTYIGVTLDSMLPRRVRQHNGEIAGGAISTRGKGPWKVVTVVSGFSSRQQVSKFEWNLHHVTFKPPMKSAPIIMKRKKDVLERRLEDLENILEKFKTMNFELHIEDVQTKWEGSKNA